MWVDEHRPSHLIEDNTSFVAIETEMDRLLQKEAQNAKEEQDMVKLHV
jgi:hypothetical protein